MFQARCFGQFQLRDGFEEPLQELAAGGAIQILKRLRQELEERVLGRHRNR